MAADRPIAILAGGTMIDFQNVIGFGNLGPANSTDNSPSAAVKVSAPVSAGSQEKPIAVSAPVTKSA